MRSVIFPFLSAVIMISAVGAGSGCIVQQQPPPKAKPAEEPPPAAKPKLQFTPPPVENGQLKLPGPVVFESGKDILKPESDEVLSIVKQYLDAKPEVTLMRIEGHTDSDGDDKSNQTLSELRSLAVAKWLVAKGTDCKRLIPVGFGETKPIAPNDTADNKAQNRRTAFVNAGLRGKPIGGMAVDGGGKVAGDPCR